MAPSAFGTCGVSSRLGTCILYFSYSAHSPHLPDSPQPTPVAAFNWHKAPVTSVEWHPTEDSVFAASGADDQTTLWDLAVEQDEEELGGADMAEGDVPPQLLFVHQGQKDVKEVHWHPQIPGAVITTAFDSFNVFKTISV